MAEDADTHTSHLIQEMRAEMRGRFDQTDGSLADLMRCADGNTILLNLLSGFAHGDESCLARLDTKSSYS